MDVKKGKPASRFCPIRDVIAHPATDRAYKKILESDEFKELEFSITNKCKYAFVRKEKNFKILQIHIPELIRLAQEIFFEYNIVPRNT